MAKVANLTARRQAIAASAAVHTQPTESGFALVTAAEAGRQITYHSAGVASDFHAVVSANATTTDSTIITRLNGANGSQLLTIAGGTTGEFEDDVNTDTIADGDEYNYLITVGATSTLTLSFVGHSFAATTNTVKRMGGDERGMSTASTVFYRNVIAQKFFNTTEAHVQNRFETAGTLKNFLLNVGANARSTDTVFVSRINGADGNQTLTIAGGATGIAEDTTNTDTIADEDLVNFKATTGTGTGEINVSMAFDFETTNNKFLYSSVTLLNNTMARNSTIYSWISSRIDVGNTTEANDASDAQFAMTLSELSAYVSANGISSGDTTVRTRVNAGNGNQSLTIAAATTGEFSDASNSDTIAVADEINYSIVTGVGSGSQTIVFQHISCLAETLTTRIQDIIQMGLIAFPR